MLYLFEKVLFCVSAYLHKYMLFTCFGYCNISNYENHTFFLSSEILSKNCFFFLQKKYQIFGNEIMRPFLTYHCAS